QWPDIYVRMTPTRRMRALGCASLILGFVACRDLAKKRPIDGEAGAAGNAGNVAGEASGGEPSPPLSGASGTNDSSQGGGNGDESCLPGVTRCHGPLGFQRCEPDGTWGDSQTCAGY